MKLTEVIAVLIYLFFTFSFLACSSEQQKVSADSTIKDSNIITKQTPPANQELGVADENFVKEAKEKYDETAEKLEKNRQLWQKNNIENYSFVIAKNSGGTFNEWNRSPVIITFSEGNISLKSYERERGDMGLERTDGFEDINTIDKLFNYIQNELDNGKIIEVKYHKKFGYPKLVSLVYTFSHSHNYHNIWVSKFEIIK